MKKLGFLGRVIFFFNSIFAVLLLLSYLLPYIPPHIFPAIALLSLLLPVLLIINGLFFLYWLFRGRKQFLLSGFVLALGIFHILSLVRFGGKGVEKDTDFSILSYNVRSFNSRNWSDQEDVGDKIHAFIYRENPDIVSIQEFSPAFGLDEEVYPYNDRTVITSKKNYGQVIYSKYPIINSGSLDFKKTYNNGIYADIVVKEDTIRLYNVHFQSLRITPNFDKLQEEAPTHLVSRLGTSFKKQEAQMNQFLESEATSPYPVIVAGDFNNSATSYLYRKVKGDKNDAFAKAGSGTGATYTFDFVPLRIDFILADPNIEVVTFETYDLPLSDHQPIKSTFNLD